MFESAVVDFFKPDYAEQVLLRHIVLTSYRNYSALKVDFSGCYIVLTGNNGSGKTNLLEAISFLSPGRGLRRASYQDISSRGLDFIDSTGFSVHVRLECANYGEASIGTGIAGTKTEGTGRRIRINGIPQSADRMQEYCRIIWFTPSMDRIFTGPSSERRRFLDRMVLSIDPGHGRRVLDYEKTMRGRNRLLAENSRNMLWLDALETEMAELGIAISAARHELIRLLSLLADSVLQEGHFPRSVLFLEGTVENSLLSLSAVDAEEEFRHLLRKNRSADRFSGRTLEGPHRTDLQIFHGSNSMPAVLCSTGEQKALLTGLVLSHARLTGELSGITPILLLDEITAHLDSLRRKALFDILERLGSQVFLTGTDEIFFRDIEEYAEFFLVQDGFVHRVRK